MKSAIGGKLAADVARLAEGLGNLPEPVVTPALIVVSGLPGTGKSYFSSRLVERLGVVVLESDALRKVLFPSPAYSWQESAYLFRVIHELIRMLLARQISVVLDATNLAERSRESLYSIADHIGARLVLVEVKAPPELVHSRLESRKDSGGTNSEADWTVYERMLPTVEEIRRHHFVVDTSRDIEPVIDKVVKEATR
jgi:predicted kinase